MNGNGFFDSLENDTFETVPWERGRDYLHGKAWKIIAF